MRGSLRLAKYHSSPPQYGRYPLVHHSTAIIAYPDIRPVPKSIPRPSYVPRNFFDVGWGDHDPVEDDHVELGRMRLDKRGMQGVRTVGRMAGEVLREVGKLVKPGITTDEIDEAVHLMIISRGAYPSTLGYISFPRSCTTAVNNVIVHGIPDDRPLDSRDIVNIDLTLFYEGYHGDTSATFTMPEVDEQGKALVAITKESLDTGIKVCGPGTPLSEIGRVIENLADKHNLSVNKQFTGHFIGSRFHSLPYILHHRNREEGVMAVGDCFTIEPCLVQGINAKGFLWDDGWTISTETGARSAQFEHQILITEDGAEVLTRID